MKQKDIKDVKDTKKKKKKSIVRRIIGWILLIALFAAIGYGIYFFVKVQQNGGGLTGVVKTAMGYDENKKKNMQPINFLVLGESGVGDGYKLTDTILVCSYNPKLQKASMLSIPRDTYVGKRDKNSASQNYLASYKMNSVYRNGTNIDETVECVRNLLGFTKDELKYYVLIDTDALIKVVDAVGGVTFDVPIDMDYDDPTQDLHIHLKAGVQLLDGDKAEQLVRFRHNNDWSSYPVSYGDNDLGRMRTQREFVQEAAKQILQTKNIFQIKELVQIGFESIKTNFDDLSIAFDYIPYALDFNTENIKTGALPGTPELVNGVWIYTANKKETAKVVEDLFKYKEEENTNIKETTLETTGETVKEVVDDRILKIEIVNATGKEDILDKLKDKLKLYGYEVEFENSKSSIPSTTITARKKDLTQKQEELKRILGVNSNNKEDISETSEFDFIVILGQDYK